MAFVEARIVRADLFEVAVPLRIPFAISGGIMTHRRSLIVVLESASGVRGFGEAAPFEQPFYSAETIQSAAACLREVLIPRVIGTTLDHSAGVRNLLADNVRGNRMARASLDTAWWDLQSRAQNLSLANLVDDRLRELGLPSPNRNGDALVCGAALGIPRNENVAELATQAHDALRLGFRRIKIKVRPGWSVVPLREVLNIVREKGVDVDVTIDANAAFSMVRDEAELLELDAAGATFIEQPFGEEDVWDSTTWARDHQTPLCLDESLVGDDMARQILEMGGPNIWNLKVQRLGGMEETCRVYVRGAQSGARMWMGTMPETGLGVQFALAFGGLGSLVFASDVGPSGWWYDTETDLVSVKMDKNGRVRVPQTPGNTPKMGGAVHLARWDERE